jgi:hypothetical protein
MAIRRPRVSRVIDARRSAQASLDRANGADGEYEYQMVFFDADHRRHVVRLSEWAVKQLRQQIEEALPDE